MLDMKTIITTLGQVGSFVAFAMFVSTPVAAQDVTMTLTGEVETVCGAYDDDSSPVEINFGMLSDVEVGQQTPEVANTLTVVCNDPDGGVVTVESENGGSLFREGTSGGSGNQVGYTVAGAGNNGLTFSATDLTSPVTRPFLGSPNFLTGEQLTISFRANGVSQDAPAGNNAPATTVYAGVYNDIVRVSVTAN